MNVCKKCKAFIDVNMDRCPNCNYPQEDNLRRKVCFECNKVYPSYQKSCPKCGKVFVEILDKKTVAGDGKANDVNVLSLVLFIILGLYVIPFVLSFFLNPEIIFVAPASVGILLFLCVGCQFWFWYWWKRLYRMSEEKQITIIKIIMICFTAVGLVMNFVALFTFGK